MNENIVQARENRYVHKAPKQSIRGSMGYSTWILSNNDVSVNVYVVVVPRDDVNVSFLILRAMRTGRY